MLLLASSTVPATSTRSGRRRTQAWRRCGREVVSQAAELVAARASAPGSRLGGTTLAPLWNRYGSSPLGLVEEGNVFTPEYGTAVPGRGYIGLEEDILVTADGIEWLATPQRELWLVA